MNSRAVEIEEIRQAKIEFLEKLAALFDEYRVSADFSTGYYGDDYSLSLTIDSEHARWPLDKYPGWYVNSVASEKYTEIDTGCPDADDFRLAITQIKNKNKLEGETL